MIFRKFLNIHKSWAFGKRYVDLCGALLLELLVKLVAVVTEELVTVPCLETERSLKSRKNPSRNLEDIKLYSIGLMAEFK